MAITNISVNIFEAINGKAGEWWTASAIAEVKNFLKKDSWRIVKKAIVLAMGGNQLELSGYSRRRMSQITPSGTRLGLLPKATCKIPGVDYTENFSPVAQPMSVRITLAMVLVLGCKIIQMNLQCGNVDGSRNSGA